MPNQPSHLATISPIDPGTAAQVLNLPSLLVHNAMLITILSGWVILMPLAWLYGPFINLLAVLIPCWVLATVVLAFIYPEWPINQLLCSRLRSAISRRPNRPNWVMDPEHRVVELVPRVNWSGSQWALETATDLLLLRIDSCGVQMEGDRDRYVLPHQSIMGAELHTIRPPGWFTDVHMVAIYARTESGPIEIPISYRDHRLGRLRCSRRRAEAIDLVDKINQVATGGTYQPTADASWFVHERHRRTYTPQQAINPYATPQDV